MPPHGSNHPGEQRAHVSVGGLPYLLALPAALSAASSSFPLLLFLHGAGESGSNPQELLAEGATGTPTSLAKAHAPHLEQFIVASPQTDRGWDGQPGELVVKLLDELLEDKRLKIDAHRVYLSGVSMGGAGVWSVASAHPARFAAIVPVCGYGNAERVASALAASPARHTPKIFVWHGANDVVVPVGASDEVVAALKARGRTDVRYERIAASPAPVGWPDYTGHAAWLPAFAAESSLWPWLLEQRLSS